MQNVSVTVSLREVWVVVDRLTIHYQGYKKNTFVFQIVGCTIKKKRLGRDLLWKEGDMFSPLPAPATPLPPRPPLPPLPPPREPRLAPRLAPRCPLPPPLPWKLV